MMGRQSGQLSMVVMDLSELIPDDHLLRRISRVISFDFIYELLSVFREIVRRCVKSGLGCI